MNIDALSLELSSTVDRVVSALRTAIFEGRIAPGEQLREQSLSDRLGVSRNTVREALRVLCADGIAIRQPNRGVVVCSLTPSEIEDIFLAREVLELQAARACATCHSRALEALSRAMDAYALAALQEDISLAATTHIEVHTAMVALTGSERLAKTERALMRELQVLIATIDVSRDDLPREVEKHRHLLELFRARDVQAALACVAEDLAHAKVFLLERGRGG